MFFEFSRSFLVLFQIPRKKLRISIEKSNRVSGVSKRSKRHENEDEEIKDTSANLAPFWGAVPSILGAQTGSKLSVFIGSVVCEIADDEGAARRRRAR